MHILFFTDNFPPEVNAPASRTFEHCREWVKRGHQVTVITGAPNFPKGKVFDGYRNRAWQAETVSGIRVIRVWTYITANEGFRKRVLDYISFMISAIIAGPFVRNVDLIVGTSPQFFTVCAAYVNAVLKRLPWVFELRDIWPESIRAVGAMKESRILDFLEKVEMFLYRKADAIISVTSAFRDSLITRGIDSEKITVITNGVDLTRFSPRQKDPELTHALKLDGKFVAGYVGTHGMAHALDTVLDAARLIASAPDGDSFRFLLLGDGASKSALVERARSDRLNNLIFLDSTSKDEVVRYWSLLDVSIIHLKKTPLFTTVIPSKLFECMAMAIPVLHGVQGESAEIVSRHSVGVLFEPENPEDLCKQLRQLKGDQDYYSRLKSNGPSAAINYDRAVLARRMLDILENIAER